LVALARNGGRGIPRQRHIVRVAFAQGAEGWIVGDEVERIGVRVQAPVEVIRGHL
jgi:hypothetical protein